MGVFGGVFGGIFGGVFGGVAAPVVVVDPFRALVARRAPSALTLDDAEWALIVEQVDAWSPTHTTGLARLYLACHFVELALQAATGAIGPIASESLGPSSVSYAAGAWLEQAGDWGSTRWGAAYASLVVTGGPDVIP